MVDHPWLALGPRRLAVHAGTGGTAGREACGEVTVRASAADRHPRAGGIQYAAASRLNCNCAGILDRPLRRAIAHKAGDDSYGCGCVVRCSAQFVARMSESDMRETAPGSLR